VPRTLLRAMLRDPRPRVLLPTVPRTGLWLPVAACVALAALSLLRPSAPTYDPWAWIIWGREILHLDLNTIDGPSWKPLPVLFTTPFALFGDSAAPALWLVVARAGSLGALVVAYRLASRLGGIAAGVLVVALFLASPWFVRHGLLGNSEGLLILFVLWAVDRHLSGRHGQAFALAVAAGLLRPEAWPFLLLYALWLLWRDRSRLPWLAGGLALLPILWLLPELWGSGDLWRASERANTPNPNSPAFAEFPSIAVLGRWALLPTPPAWVGMGAALVLGLRERAWRRPGPMGGMAVLAVAWLVLVMLMTEAGYSGNERYLLAPTALLYVVGAAGLARLAARLVPTRPGRVAAAAIAALAVGGCVIWGADRLPFLLRDVRFQAKVAEDLDVAIARAGGRDAILACGTPFTNEFLVQLLAWKLKVHGERIELEPSAGGNVMFAARDWLGGRVDPPLDALEGRRDRELAAKTAHWRVETACGA